MRKSKHSRSWLNQPWDGIVGKGWHEKICSLIDDIVLLANKKAAFGRSNWKREDIRVSISSHYDDETHWHVDFAKHHVRGTGPVMTLEGLIEIIKKTKYETKH